MILCAAAFCGANALHDASKQPAPAPSTTTAQKASDAPRTPTREFGAWSVLRTGPMSVQATAAAPPRSFFTALAVVCTRGVARAYMLNDGHTPNLRIVRFRSSRGDMINNSVVIEDFGVGRFTLQQSVMDAMRSVDVFRIDEDGWFGGVPVAVQVAGLDRFLQTHAKECLGG